MNQCPRCHGDGYIFGHWMPEICPECGDDPANVPATVNEPAPEVDAFVIGAILFGAAVTSALMWGVIAFFAAVLG